MRAESAESAQPRVAGVILAAGGSRRFAGQLTKVVQDLDGEPLVRRVAKAALASRLQEVIVVVGHQAGAVRDAVAGMPLRIAENHHWQSGQSTSVHAGLDALEGRSQAALFLPADQPLVSTLLIDRLVNAYTTGAPIVVTTWKGERRAPVLFGRRYFAELRKLNGDTGGRALLPRHPSTICEVPATSTLEVADVDDAASLDRLREASS